MARGQWREQFDHQRVVFQGIRSEYWSSVIRDSPDSKTPIKVGVGVKGGAEATVHAARRYLESIRDCPDKVMVKLDFKNAFNCIRRDRMLEAVAELAPEIYAFCNNAACHPLIRYNNSVIESATGVQQRDPLRPLLFSITLHPLLVRTSSEPRVGFLDDVTIGGTAYSVGQDVEFIMQEARYIGLEVNPAKCEVIGDARTTSAFKFSNFVRVLREDAELLGSPLNHSSKQDKILENKCKELSIAISRLHLLDSHYSLSIITHCISAPKLLYTLCTSCCFDNDFLAQFDIIVKTGLESVLNVSLSDHQWLQASLPVGDGGIGVRSVVSLAPSAFLASAASSQSLQNEIIPTLSVEPDTDFNTCLSHWSEWTSAAPVVGPAAVK